MSSPPKSKKAGSESPTSKSKKAGSVSPPPASSAAAPVPDTLIAPSHWTEQGLPADDDSDADSTLGLDGVSSTASLSSSILHYRTIAGRTYNSERSTSQHWAPNDEAHNEGMDIQHHVWTLCLGDKLFMAPLEKDKVKNVLDIGTGTGVWPIDFADEFPDARIVATDLSPTQPTWAPPNVYFEIDDFNEEWTFQEESFDYIHMRWLLGAVPDYTVLLKRAYRFLKPGGWIEVMDSDAEFSCDDGTITPASAMGQWKHIFVEGAKKLGMPNTFMPIFEGKLLQGVQEAGFVNINEKRIKNPFGPWAKDEKLREVGMYQLATLDADISGYINLFATELGWSPQQIMVYVAHLRRELKAQKLHGYSRVGVVWAQRPE